MQSYDVEAWIVAALAARRRVKYPSMCEQAEHIRTNSRQGIRRDAKLQLGTGRPQHGSSQEHGAYQPGLY